MTPRRPAACRATSTVVTGVGNRPHPVGTPDTSGRLRAERDGAGGDRVHTLTYGGHDEIGRPIGCTVTVTVPHDQGRA